MTESSQYPILVPLDYLDPRMGKRMWNEPFMFPFPFLRGKLLVVSWGKWQRDVRSSFICPPRSLYLHSLKSTNMRPKSWGGNAEEIFLQIGRRKMWPAEGTRHILEQVSPGLKKWEEQGGKSDGEESALEGIRCSQGHGLLVNSQ